MRLLGTLASLNSFRFFLTLIAVGIVALVMGNAAGRSVGSALIVIGVVLALNMARSFAKPS